MVAIRRYTPSFPARSLYCHNVKASTGICGPDGPGRRSHRRVGPQRFHRRFRADPRYLERSSQHGQLSGAPTSAFAVRRHTIVLGFAGLASVLGCGGKTSRLASTTPIPGPNDSCPAITDAGTPDSAVVPATKDSNPRILVRDGPRLHPIYVSVLIDGQWAAWNDDERGANFLGPDLDPKDIDRIEVIKGAHGRPYGVCPGVGLIVITTKSKKWRPSRNP